MSWFETSGFASLAKSALKEAQKTIDKALDIKDEEQKAQARLEGSTDFFSSWGLKGETERKTSDPSPSQKPQDSGIWGSFTGSFFENPKSAESPISESPESSQSAARMIASRSLPESLGHLEEVPETCITKNELHVDRSETSRPDALDVVRRQGTKKQVANRISALSALSNRKSSESVEILGTETDGTPTSESEGNLISCSESVEVLPSSTVTSPSSVEILGDWQSESPSYLSPTEVNESTVCSDLSTIDLPIEGVVLSTPAADTSKPIVTANAEEVDDQILPESIQVTDVDETDKVSIADDSYASVSESTVTTILEVKTIEPSDITKMHDSCLDQRQISIDSENSLNLSLDSLQEKVHSLHLPIEPIITQPDWTVETKNLDAERIKSTIIEPQESQILQKSETAESSEQYLMLTDSSCEGTLIESSSEDNVASIGPCGTSSSTELPLSASSYVKNLLADAMAEKNELIADVDRQCIEVARENSPISSESRSDLVKIGSDQTSGHTSGDELETTTSSDIEIISSPNGDSSSTQSRQSPAKFHLSKGSDLLTKTLKTRGHSRELSEISVGSDDASLEIERLLRRIREMTEILEAREAKLIEVSRTNMELHEQNSGLKKQLDSVEKHVEHSQDITQITDEYTQRLSALERKFQQAIRERDSLRKNLEQLKQETSSRPSLAELTGIVSEKDEIIKELRDEGEKLSKQQLQHCNIIKKLRTKEKDNDALIKSQKEQIEEQNSELERLKRSLYAKEEVERSQIDAVHTLTAKTKKQEKEIFSLQEKLDHTTNKMEAYKLSLEAAKTELAETRERLSEVEDDLKISVDNIGDSMHLSAQVEDLKVKLRQAEEASIRKEESLKLENLDVLKRLESAEARSEELSESVSAATKPLLRQLEQLQTNLTHKTNYFMRQEEVMLEKIADLQAKLENYVEINRSLKEENTNFKSKVSVLETKINLKESENAKMGAKCDLLKLETEKLVQENAKNRQTIKILEEAHSGQIAELKREIDALEAKLSIEKAATEAEKRKNNIILEHQQSIDEELRCSPTLSIERESVSSANSIWPVFNDSMFDSSSGRFPNVYDSLRTGANSTSMFENMQAQLKQRDGEVQQLQWELSRRNIERDALNAEVSQLSSKVEDLSVIAAKVDSLKENLNDIQTKYDALLQMYGEKVEETEELRLDLSDVKEMYKTQIDQLLKRDS